MSPRLCSALLVAAAAAWAPEAEFATLHGTSQATWRGRVDAELDRSLNALLVLCGSTGGRDPSLGERVDGGPLY